MTTPADSTAQARALLEEYEAAARGTARPGDLEAGRAILSAEAAIRVAAILAILELLAERRVEPGSVSSGDRFSRYYRTFKPLLGVLLRGSPPPFMPEDVEHILDILVSRGGVWTWYLPLRSLVRGIQASVASHGLTPAIRGRLEQLLNTPLQSTGNADERAAWEAIEAMLGLVEPVPPLIDARDDWGNAAALRLEQLTDTERARWSELLRHAATASGSQPSAAWLARARRAMQPLGEDYARELILAWLDLLRAPSLNGTYRAQGGDGGSVGGLLGELPTAMFTERNTTLLTGLIWCCRLFEPELIAGPLGRAAEACFHKVPRIGPRSTRAGNACVHVLAVHAGSLGISELLRLRERLTAPTVQRSIASTLARVAGAAGLTAADLEELSTPGHGLVEGRLERSIGPYVAEIVVAGAHEVEMRWRRPDGRVLAAEPAAARRDWPEEVRALRTAAAEVRTTLAVIRRRLEGLAITGRALPLRLWRQRYLDHPLVGVLARRLIWLFGEGADTRAGAWRAGGLVDIRDQPLDGLDEDTFVGLWHPLLASAAEVLAWRTWLERHAIRQPFKQAHRELYLLTDAERRTGTYSNRFAGHILRQDQFSALLRQRGWRSHPQGSMTSQEDMPWRELPSCGLRAEFWVQTAGEEDVLGVTDNVATDQVRFVPIGQHEPVPLVNVPPLVFSEVMRDVDLFVGVCGVAVDPTWRDRGPAGQRAYWERVAFGELSATAATRRAVFERLLPRLAQLRDRCTLTDRFLVVRGDLRTYKIHVGSGNILMEPNDQYLCIVPDQSAETWPGARFLPFEGDGTLAVILSKALLLADDRKITDPTITRQIGL